MKKLIAAFALTVLTTLTLTAPTYAFEAVEAPSVHVSEPSVSEHSYSAPSESTSHSTEPSETFRSSEDTGGTSDYHATYPFWVYTVHPSTDCEQKNQNCPPTDPKQLAKYNQQKHQRAVTTAWVIGIIAVAGVLIVGALVFTM